MVHFPGLPQVALFWLNLLSRFFIGKKLEFGLVSFKEIVALFEKLMLSFKSPKSDLYNLSYGSFFGTATA